MLGGFLILADEGLADAAKHQGLVELGLLLDGGLLLSSGRLLLGVVDLWADLFLAALGAGDLQVPLVLTLILTLLFLIGLLDLDTSLLDFVLRSTRRYVNVDHSVAAGRRDLVLDRLLILP